MVYYSIILTELDSISSPISCPNQPIGLFCDHVMKTLKRTDVGGFNPSEKYADRQIGNLPQIGVNIKNIFPNITLKN